MIPLEKGLGTSKKLNKKKLKDIVEKKPKEEIKVELGEVELTAVPDVSAENLVPEIQNPLQLKFLRRKKEVVKLKTQLELHKAKASEDILSTTL
jgi:ribosomal protein L14E/L6E/L27E